MSSDKKQATRDAMLEFASKVREIVNNMGLSATELHIGPSAPTDESKIWGTVNGDKIEIKIKYVEGETVSWKPVYLPEKINDANLSINLRDRQMVVSGITRDIRTIYLSGTSIGNNEVIIMPAEFVNRPTKPKTFIDESMTSFHDNSNGRTYSLSAMFNKGLTDLYIDGSSVNLVSDPAVDLTNFEYNIAVNYLS